ncbi:MULTISPECIES: maltose acetyltransferase domain-containing protein [Anaerococcus]|nr:maltose acetyltransferase domain-containing protein [Anaerococcus sp.]
MNEYEKMISSQTYNANYDEELWEMRIFASDLC